MSRQQPDPTPDPTPEQAAELISFLTGFENRIEPFATWEGGGYDKERKMLQMSYPRYARDVNAFYYLVAESQWICYDYLTDRTRELVNNIDQIQTATLDEIKAILTWFWRGERFHDGHMAGVLKAGIVQAALRRLASLYPGSTPS